MTSTDTQDELVRLFRVSERTGLPKSTIYQRISEGTFPKPVPLGGGKVAWLESEISAWIKQRIAERDLPRKSKKRRAAQ